MTPLQTQISSDLSQLKPKFDFELAPITYFKIGGPAEVYFELDDRDKIIKLVKYCQEKNIKLTILSGGSNVIVADEGIKGVVLNLTIDSIEKSGKLGEKTLVTAESGVKTAILVRKTIDLGLTGLEYFLGVPGKLGGAVYNNAHYLEHLIAEHIRRVEIITETSETVWLDKADCDFGYDKSRFQQTKEVILRVEFALKAGTKEESNQLIKEATQYRANTQPLGKPSSGCIFQNAPNTEKLKQTFPQFKDKKFIGGGFLIDRAGLKNKKIGGISVSDKHAAFFINDGSGTAQDVLKLIQIVKQAVKDKFGVELEEEVFFLN